MPNVNRPLRTSSTRFAACRREHDWRTRFEHAGGALVARRRTGLGIFMATILLCTMDVAAVAAQSCFSPHSLPRCRSFWITETGLTTRLNDHQQKGAALTMELGYMVNRSDRSALGAAVFVRGSDAIGGVAGFRPRYRRWLTENVSIDVAPGIVIQTLDGGEDLEAPAFSGLLALNVTSGLALITEVDLARYDRNSFYNNGRSWDVAWYAGGRLGGGPGVAGAAVALGLAALVAATWSSW